MKPTILINRIYRSVSGWLVYHKFKESSGDIVISSINKEAVKLKEAIRVFILAEKYPSPIFDPVSQNFNAIGAMLMHSHINKHLYSIEDYPDVENSRTREPSYFRSVRDNVSCSSNVTKVLKSFDAGKLKGVPCGDKGKWSRFFYSVPELMFFGHFKQEYLKQFYADYMFCITRLMVFERRGYVKEDEKSYDYLQEQLLKVITSGFYIFSFNLYSKIYSEVPYSSKDKIPQIKLKMKKNDECMFNRADIDRMGVS